MPSGLERRSGPGHFHFITFSCDQRRPYLATPEARDRVLDALETMRQRYRFHVDAYVVMPEHVHLLIGEPAVANISTVLQAIKLSVARRSATTPFWLARFYDFNVYSDMKRIDKRRYIHRNPVWRGLVSAPGEWAWSSYRHWATGEAGRVQVLSPFTWEGRVGP